MKLMLFHNDKLFPNPYHYCYVSANLLHTLITNAYMTFSFFFSKLLLSIAEI